MSSNKRTRTPATVWLTPVQQRCWRSYRKMRTLLDLQLARDLARDSDLSEADYDVLSTLSERPDPWRAGDLALRLSWSTSRLTHHTGRMQARGLVTRDTCAEDGRGAMLSLTDTGWATLRAAAPLHVTSVRSHFIGLLTASELKTLTAITERVNAHLESAQADPRPTGHA